MNDNKRREYVHVKNYIHNDAKISKEFIIDLCNKRVDAVLDEHIERLFSTNRFEALLLRKIGEVVSGTKDFGRSTGGSGDERTKDFIKDEIKKKVAEEVMNRIDFSALEIVKK